MNPFREPSASGSWIGGIQIAGQLGMKPSSSVEHTLEMSHEAVGAWSGLAGHSIDVTEKSIYRNLCGRAPVGMAATRCRQLGHSMHVLSG